MSIDCFVPTRDDLPPRTLRLLTSLLEDLVGGASWETVKARQAAYAECLQRLGFRAGWITGEKAHDLYDAVYARTLQELVPWWPRGAARAPAAFAVTGSCYPRSVVVFAARAAAFYRTRRVLEAIEAPRDVSVDEEN